MTTRYRGLSVMLLSLTLLAAACGNNNQGSTEILDEPTNQQSDSNTIDQGDDSKQGEAVIIDPVLAEPDPEPEPESEEPEQIEQPPVKPGVDYSYDASAVEVVAEPAAIEVLVNKINALPKDYAPSDLVEPDVPFIFSEKLDKRKMRKEAAEALEQLFAGAKSDEIGLAGVSGYRSYATQKALFQRYADRDGIEAASRYSARPGHSEHSTGLAMDVTGSDGKCAATDCFGGTPAALWLADHAHEYGFIIRYPNGKEEITGYKYEPWHLRYVGIELAEVIHTTGLTLEEYYEDAEPVAQ
jgi:D-alanyl-D-alanine carboxypeptidase